MLSRITRATSSSASEPHPHLPPAPSHPSHTPATSPPTHTFTHGHSSPSLPCPPHLPPSPRVPSANDPHTAECRRGPHSVIVYFSYRLEAAREIASNLSKSSNKLYLDSGSLLLNVQDRSGLDLESKPSKLAAAEAALLQAQAQATADLTTAAALAEARSALADISPAVASSLE